MHIWKESERQQLRAELDAAYFHLYGIERDDVEYMLSTFTNTGFVRPADRGANGAAWQPGGTGAMVLEAYDRMGR